MKPIRRFAVDIGNSGARIVPLPAEPGEPLPEPLRIPWHLKSGELSQDRLSQLLADGMVWRENLVPWASPEEPSEWWISSVHRAAEQSLREFLRSRPLDRVRVIDHRQVPLQLSLQSPERVGIDRLLAAFAAGRMFPERPLIVIQAGTAVTVDLLDACAPHEQVENWQNNPSRGGTAATATSDREHRAENRPVGCFCGGAILPGVPMMLRLLGSAADMLPVLEAEELIELPPLPGRDTRGAMLAGVSSCLVGGVQHLLERYRRARKIPLPVVLSGGDGPALRSHLAEPVFEVPHLVLQGLRLLASEA